MSLRDYLSFMERMCVGFEYWSEVLLIKDRYDWWEYKGKGIIK